MCKKIIFVGKNFGVSRVSTGADVFGDIPRLIVCIAAHRTHLSIVALLPRNGT